MAFQLPDPGKPNLEFARPSDHVRLERVAEALRARGTQVTIADSADHARDLVLGMIDEGAQVHVALSETMRILGVTSEVDESGRYDSVRAALKAFDRRTQWREMARLAASPDYMLGSVHAITEDGIVLIASGSGSQLGAEAYGAGTVVFAVGHQKIVRDVPEGLRRIHEYCLPLEFARMQTQGAPGSLVSKILMVEADLGNRIHVVLIPETIGF